ncbi:hypothetical protein AMAG_03767 [Allomyces macrogynus ATCC 38327]|uniref:Uncharacterized protein n=1 Tax=Allomyces macrogynus (strain ATCC 38327) TaxID=578462 RepID=A0A0L0SAN7_ALLM3|nr:hypothetical protein AMAG_03767 [Allomyces macrogynus ATCC 38327]|eukprot:KNE59492.1 hypothetical protein AMAG_03767 [Allomyces macrogynus ATCC 38327]
MPPPPYAPGALGTPTGPTAHPPPPPPPPASSLLHPSTPIAYAFQVHMASAADAALNPVPVPDAAELSTLRDELQGLARTAAARSLDLEREIAALEQWISTARRAANARPPVTPVAAPGLLADRASSTPLAGPIDLSRSNSWTSVAVPGGVAAAAAGARTDRSRPSRSVEPASPASSVDVKSEPGLVDAARRKRSIGALDDVPPPPRIKIKVEDTRTASSPLPLAMPLPSAQSLPPTSLLPNGSPAPPVDPHRKRKLERRGTASSSGTRRSTTAPPSAAPPSGSPHPGASPAPPAAPAIPPPPPAPPGMTVVQYVDRPYYYRNFLGDDAVAQMPATETLQGDDYSKVKVNDKQQTALPTFYSYIDAWLRPVTEDDIAFLTKQNASVSASTTPGAVAAAAAAAAAAVVAPSPIPGRNSPAPGAPIAAAAATPTATIGTSAVPTDLARYFLVPKLGKPHLPQVGTSTSPLDPATPAVGLPPHAHPALDVTPEAQEKASDAAAAAIADGTAGVKNHEKRTGRADSEPPPPQGPTTEPFPDQIGVLMQKRRDLIASAGAVFAGHDEEAWKIPCNSIYDGIPRNVKLDEAGTGAGATAAAGGGTLPAASGPPPLPVPPPGAAGKVG